MVGQQRLCGTRSGRSVPPLPCTDVYCPDFLNCPSYKVVSVPTSCTRSPTDVLDVGGKSWTLSGELTRPEVTGCTRHPLSSDKVSQRLYDIRFPNPVPNRTSLTRSHLSVGMINIFISITSTPPYLTTSLKSLVSLRSNDSLITLPTFWTSTKRITDTWHSGPHVLLTPSTSLEMRVTIT